MIVKEQGNTVRVMELSDSWLFEFKMCLTIRNCDKFKDGENLTVDETIDRLYDK